MRTWLDLFDLYLTDVTGCTIKAACDALREAAQIFCERTKVWRSDLDPVLTRPDQQFYEFDTSDEVQVIKVFAVKLAGADVPLYLEAKAGQQCIQAISPVQFALYPPAKVKGLKLEFNVALMPTNTASGIEDWVADRYARQLVLGAKSILYGAADKPYSNQGAAIDMRGQFDAAIADVKGEVAAAFSTAPVRVQAQFF